MIVLNDGLEIRKKKKINFKGALTTEYGQKWDLNFFFKLSVVSGLEPTMFRMVDGVPSSGREERRQLARLCGGF